MTRSLTATDTHTFSVLPFPPSPSRRYSHARICRRLSSRCLRRLHIDFKAIREARERELRLPPSPLYGRGDAPTRLTMSGIPIFIFFSFALYMKSTRLCVSPALRGGEGRREGRGWSLDQRDKETSFSFVFKDLGLSVGLLVLLLFVF